MQKKYIFILFLMSIFSIRPKEGEISFFRMLDNEQTESRTVKKYNKITLDGSIKIVLMPVINKNDNNILILQGDKDLAQQVKTTVENFTLHIKLKHSPHQHGDSLYIICFVKDLKSIVAENGARLTMDNKLWHKPLKSKALAITARTHAKIILLKLEVNQLVTKVESEAEVVVAGWAKKHSVQVASDGILQATDLKTDETVVNVTTPTGVLAYIWS